ncbi:hypothetical protein [Oceanobacillus bengalensis]|uniref:GerMN domain-containing protein n=1 Tax=Oceanobacillus bengalensis TaxID=1435466 RepID=A0A494Z1E8_9BACI|nr:hypothetical protein [Oceanobacillus bengalensis]RKQ16115.1 hypothetical protein D8M05_08430 [Oceanobacillus bengalensis]
MNNEKQHDEKIVEALKNMPNITDETPKNIVYQRVSSNMSNERVRKGKSLKLLPFFGTILTVALLLVIPFILDTTSYETTVEDNAMEAKTEEDAEVITELESDMNNKSSIMQENTPEREEAEQEIMMDGEAFKYSVVPQLDNDSNLIYGAIPDEQFQYVIPITLLVSEDRSMNEHYNKLEQYISEVGLLKTDYLLKDVTFMIEQEENVVTIKLPEKFTLDSSAQAYMLLEMLETMFVPLGIKKAVFISDGEEAIDLGPIGIVEELPLQVEGKFNYKKHNQLLVPIPLEEEVIIDEAIIDMKNNDGYLVQTIPEHVDFTIESAGDNLMLTYTGETNLSVNQQMVTMIEAILMTAKSYGYVKVEFIDMNIPSIGNYNLNEPIDVPEAVNPILRD